MSRRAQAGPLNSHPMQTSAFTRVRRIAAYAAGVAFVVVLVVVSLGMALHRALSSPPRFRASSLVLMTPFTNGLLAESFQARAFKGAPG